MHKKASYLHLNAILHYNCDKLGNGIIKVTITHVSCLTDKPVEHSLINGSDDPAVTQSHLSVYSRRWLQSWCYFIFIRYALSGCQQEYYQ